jgi:hypothetical protein
MLDGVGYGCSGVGLLGVVGTVFIFHPFRTPTGWMISLPWWCRQTVAATLIGGETQCQRSTYQRCGHCRAHSGGRSPV